jgi:hypothetical protein
VGVIEELTSPEILPALTDHNTYGIVTIKQLCDGENKEIIAPLGARAGGLASNEQGFTVSGGFWYGADIAGETSQGRPLP